MTPTRQSKRREGIIDRIGLELQVWPRLYLDKRMPLWLKLVPLAGLAYLVNPVDFPTMLDDLVVVIISLVIFMEFAPTGLAEEHRRKLRNTIESEWREVPAKDEQIIDGQFQDSDEKESSDKNVGGA